MVDDAIVSKWVYEHFLAYLYLSIADSDCTISDSELENIKTKAFKTMDENRCSLAVKEVYKEYRSHNEEERRDFIRNNIQKYLRTNAIKQKVIQDLEATVHKKDEDSVEYIMFRYIRKTINNTK